MWLLFYWAIHPLLSPLPPPTKKNNLFFSLTLKKCLPLTHLFFSPTLGNFGPIFCGGIKGGGGDGGDCKFFNPFLFVLERTKQKPTKIPGLEWTLNCKLNWCLKFYKHNLSFVRFKNFEHFQYIQISQFKIAAFKPFKNRYFSTE